MSESDSDVSMPGTPPELNCIVDPEVPYLIPEKSKANYETSYQQFKDWCNKKNKKSVTENVLLAYIVEKSKTMKSSSLLSIYSRLKCMLSIKEGLDVSNYSKVIPFLKKLSRGYKAEKSKVLTQEQIMTFLEEANDENYLLWKLILIMGISGPMNRNDLTHITLDDIEVRNDVLIVTNNNRTFTITNPDYVKLYRKYIALRSEHDSIRRLFLKYSQGRCYGQVVGKNTIGKVPSMIANYLKLPNSKQYTSHCFRSRTGNVLLNRDASTSVLKYQCNTVSFKQLQITNSGLYNCRFCLKSPQDTPFRLLSTINAAYIQSILPEIDLSLVDEPQICLDCLNSLKNAYNFKTRCLETETQIKRIKENNKINEEVKASDYEIFLPTCNLDNEDDTNSVKNDSMNEEISCPTSQIDPAINFCKTQLSCSTSLSGHLQSKHFSDQTEKEHNFKTKCLKTETKIKSFSENTKIKEEFEEDGYQFFFSSNNCDDENDTNSIKDEYMAEKVNCPISEKEDLTTNEEINPTNLNFHIMNVHNK